MSDSSYPGFRHLATDDEDDSRWRAHEAAARRATAARGTRPEVSPGARSRPSPLIIGGGLALAASVVFSAPLLLRELRHTPSSAASPSAPAAAGLKVVRREPASRPITPLRTLPCYVNGVSVGDLPLMDCAARNGVASGSLAEAPARPEAVASRDAEPAIQVSRAPAPAPASVPASERPVPGRPAPRAAMPFRLFPFPAPRAAATLRLAQSAASPRAAPPVRLALAAPRFTPPQTQYSRNPEPPVTRVRPSEAMAPRESATESPRTWAPSAEESAQAAGDFYTALGQANGARAASLVIPEKRYRGPLSAPEINRFFSSLDAPLRITDLRPLDNRTVAVRYQYIDPDGVLCSGSSEVNTTVRDGRVLVQGVRAHSRC